MPSSAHPCNEQDVDTLFLLDDEVGEHADLAEREVSHRGVRVLSGFTDLPLQGTSSRTAKASASNGRAEAGSTAIVS